MQAVLDLQRKEILREVREVLWKLEGVAAKKE